MGLSLQVYKASSISNETQSKSLLGMSNGFNIKVCRNAFWTYNQDYWRLTNVYGFQGIMLEDLSLNFQTNWGNAGGAVLGDKIASLVNSKFVKMLAGQSDHGFTPFICSDAWTQQKVSGEAQPIKVQIKFKAYNDSRMGCTNYNDVLRFLIHICSPLKSSNQKNNPNEQNIGDYTADTINNAVEGAANIWNQGESALQEVGGSLFGHGKDIAKNIPKLLDKEGRQAAAHSIGQTTKDIIDVADKTYNSLVKTTANGKNNGNFTVNFSLSNKIVDVNHKYKNQDESTISASNSLDWIITNFNFKPSRQFEMVKEGGKEYPKPLWMDFDVSLETRLSLSNKYVYDTLIDNELRNQVLK